MLAKAFLDRLPPSDVDNWTWPPVSRREPVEACQWHCLGQQMPIQWNLHSAEGGGGVHNVHCILSKQLSDLAIDCIGYWQSFTRANFWATLLNGSVCLWANTREIQEGGGGGGGE